MKRALFFSCLSLATISVTQAHPFAPPTLDWLPRSDTVYLVHVDAVKQLNDGFNSQSVTFSVVEVLRGKSRSAFTLTAVEGMTFKLGDQDILMHNPSGFPNGVGWTIEGDPEWWPLSVTEKDGKQTVEFLGPMDGVRKYIHDHPIKP